MPPIRVPSEADFADLAARLPHTLHFSSRPSTTAILLLFHGLGDTHASFSKFASSINLPNVLAISVRAPFPVPLAFAPDDTSGAGSFHWGDDILVDPSSGGIDPDPGFARAVGIVWDELVDAVLLRACGWSTRDIMLFGFGQGGSFALALARHAAKLAATASKDGQAQLMQQVDRFKGVISLGGQIPLSAVGSGTADKATSSVLLVQLDKDAENAVKRHFAQVQTVRWKRPQVDMPRNRDEMLPIMQFFAQSLNQGW
ncbi:hypothetical protein BROUX41_002178 [Berkeleyomyces rouxiae]|uniref:uncharacterized protein n=1 Tax=Berkeleyomyces rouxiae TaxID=2035830 RepID=UPI003B82520D